MPRRKALAPTPAPAPPPREPRYPAWYEKREHWVHTTTHLMRVVVEQVQMGMFRIPPFQRAWCWTDEQIIALVDSLRRGFHVGTVLLWEREGCAASRERIGEIDVASPAGTRHLVIDGQQRLGALATACLSGRFFFDLQQGALTTDGDGPWKMPAKLLFQWRHVEADRWIRSHAADHGLNPDDVWDGWVAALCSFEGVTIAFTVLPRDHDAARVVESFKRLNTMGTPMDPEELREAIAAWELLNES